MDYEKDNSDLNQEIESSIRKECKTVLLPDDPTDKDSFGTHERIANAIADVIINEEGGKSIALIGTWGSGKSTILKILKDKLLKTEVNFFLFDAWIYSGDSLRLSFLENLHLTQFSESRSKNDKISIDDNDKDKNKEPKSISGRKFSKNLLLGTKTLIKIPNNLRKEELKRAARWEKTKQRLTRTTTEQMITPLGILLLMISYALILITVVPQHYKIYVMYILFGLLLFLLFLFIMNCFSNIYPIKLFFNYKLIKSQTLTASPTLNQFHAEFDHLVSSITMDKKKLLIVIDNLDRINVELAKSIWATMRTFIDYDNFRNQLWFDKVWLLVPFSPDMPKELWSNFSDAFVDKTFQIIFQVPSLVPSDWEIYLKGKLIEAFPKHKDEPNVFHAIYCLYSAIKVQKGHIPTPRELILFVNKIGAYHRIWQDDIPLVTQAYYVLRAERFEMNINEMLNGIFEDHNLIIYLGDNYQNDLAALQTGLGKDKAYQILLGNIIENYILTANCEEFVKLINSYNFYNVLYSTIYAIYRNHIDGNMIIKTSLCVDRLGDGPANSVLQDTWDIISNFKFNVPNWPVDQQTSAGLIAIIKHSHKDKKQDLVKNITRLVSTPYRPTNEFSFSDAKSWTERAYYYLNETVKLDYYDILKEHFTFLDNVQSIFMSYSVLAKLNVKKELMKFFYPKEELKSQLIEYIYNTYKDEKAVEDEFYVDIVEFMIMLRDDWDWENLTKYLDQRIKNMEIIPWRLRLFYKTLYALKYMANNKDAERTLNDIKIGGYNEYYLFHTIGNDKIAAIIMFNNFENDEPTIDKLKYKETQEGINIYHDIRNTPEKYIKIIIEFMELIIKYKRIAYLIESYDRGVKSKYNINLVRHILNILIDDERVKSIFTIEIIRKYGERLESILGEKRYSVLLSKL